MEMGYSCAGWFLIWFHKILRNSQRHCRLCRIVEKLCDIRHLEHKVCLRKFEILQMILGWKKKRENKFDIILGSLIPEKKLYVLLYIFSDEYHLYRKKRISWSVSNNDKFWCPNLWFWCNLNKNFYIFTIFKDFLKVDVRLRTPINHSNTWKILLSSCTQSILNTWTQH